MFGFERAVHRPGKINLLSHILALLSISVCFQHQQATSFATGACLELSGFGFPPKISSERVPHESGLLFYFFVLQTFVLSLWINFEPSPSATDFMHLHRLKKRFVLRHCSSTAGCHLSVFCLYCHVSIQGGGSVIQVCSKVDETIPPLLWRTREEGSVRYSAMTVGEGERVRHIEAWEVDLSWVEVTCCSDMAYLSTVAVI